MDSRASMATAVQRFGRCRAPAVGGLGCVCLAGTCGMCAQWCAAACVEACRLFGAFCLLLTDSFASYAALSCVVGWLYILEVFAWFTRPVGFITVAALLTHRAHWPECGSIWETTLLREWRDVFLVAVSLQARPRLEQHSASSHVPHRPALAGTCIHSCLLTHRNLSQHLVLPCR